jgi:glycosyltransferase involved in cell wall biosynthesis
VIDDGVSGLMIRPGSVDTLADMMIRIYNDSELRDALGNEAYKKVSENFFTSALIPQWENLYRKLASHKKNFTS